MRFYMSNDQCIMSLYDKTDDSIVENRKTKAHSKIIWKKNRKNLYSDWRQSGSLPENMDQFPGNI